MSTPQTITRSQRARRQATFSWRSFGWLAAICWALAWLFRFW